METCRVAPATDPSAHRQQLPRGSLRLEPAPRTACARSPNGLWIHNTGPHQSRSNLHCPAIRTHPRLHMRFIHSPPDCSTLAWLAWLELSPLHSSRLLGFSRPRRRSYLLVSHWSLPTLPRGSRGSSSRLFSSPLLGSSRLLQKIFENYPKITPSFILELVR